MKKRIWFNRTFSTAYHFIDMIRTNPDGLDFEFYVTHPKRYSVMLQNADVAEIEPSLPIPEYIEYCVQFCQKHQIDIFFPNYRLVEIAKHLDRFEQVGTSVLVCKDADLLETVSDKGKLFQALRDTPGLHIPDYFIVNTSEQFKIAYEKLREKGHKVCFKPASGEGGAGFHIIEEHMNPLDKLLGSSNQTIAIDEVLSIIGDQTVDDIMVMEYLDDWEYSIDCLATEEELIAIVPRKKVEGRIRLLEENQALIDLAKAVHEQLRLPYLFNVQVKYKNGVPKLLEINPRASGGLHSSCLSGVNFPYLAVKLLLSGKVEVAAPKFGVYATHIEKEIVLRQLL
ncbi:ATP-grasp domain-containing protein [Brevibacillus sp. AG]|uniref:ATP-grasp domain-containing protein n=1 Tax=Brevibacillus sp. AG TaxID=3020891 RepID=UPI00085392B8|nr:ATP-grasp domain-containing protein [Brevibacillus sp. AG]MDC0762760.1 ATP-grasp domain-containing protein [Brevibacillus sp. AG]